MNYHELPLTMKQQQVLKIIRNYITEHGYSPTIREIMEMAGFSSLSSVTHQLGVLERRGKITRIPGASRTVRLAE